MEKISILILTIFLWSNGVIAQKNKLETPGGAFTFGVRSTISAFNDHEDESIGRGFGGQARLSLSDRVNTEWFGDFLNSNIGSYANRVDYHIGWSVLYYFSPISKQRKFQAYALAGHCFDHTKIQGNRVGDHSEKRLSSAVQAGLGFHYHFTPRFDMSFTTQYMMHLGKHIGAHMHGDEFEIHIDKVHGIEGHVLFNISFNFKIAELW